MTNLATYARGKPVTANVAICGDSGQLEPLQMQLIALRLQGLSWTKCALHLGISRETVRRWRADFPEIERRLEEESEYQLVLAREQLPSAVQSAVRRMKMIVESPVSEDKDAIAAAKLIVETVTKRSDKSPDELPAGVRDGAANERAGPQSAGSQLPAVIDAECDDDYSELIGPDKHAAR